MASTVTLRVRLLVVAIAVPTTTVISSGLAIVLRESLMACANISFAEAVLTAVLFTPKMAG
jgi:hypothetical protein